MLRKFVNTAHRSLHLKKYLHTPKRCFQQNLLVGMDKFVCRLRWDLDAAGIKKLTDDLLADGKKVLDQIAALPKEQVSWASTFKAFIDMEGKMSTLSSSVTFPSNASVDKSIRDASNAGKKDLSNFSIDTYMREDVFLVLKSFAEKGEKLERIEQRLVDRVLRDFVRNGLELPPEQREKLKDIKKEMTSLCVTANANMNEENTKLLFTKEELKGMQDDFFNGLTQTEGKYSVTLKYPDYTPIMTYCSVEETRRLMEKAFSSRCVAENMPILAKLVKLRHDAAVLLGWKNHASYTLDIRMAKNPETVVSFLNDLVQKLDGPVERDIEKLLVLKKAEKEALGQEYDGKIHAWDSTYYANKVLEQEYQIDHNEIKKYFPLHKVLSGLLDIYQEILGLVFIEEKLDLWHPEVKAFSVMDKESKEFIGQFWIDLHPREGKYGHAAVWGLQQAFFFEDGSWQFPIAAMLCNFTKPTAENPSLLKHTEVLIPLPHHSE